MSGACLAMSTTRGDKCPENMMKYGVCVPLSACRLWGGHPTYDRRRGVCVARMRAVNRAFSLERVQAARQTRLARDEAEPLPRAGVGDFRQRLW
jgi:hypothetical protein